MPDTPTPGQRAYAAYMHATTDARVVCLMPWAHPLLLPGDRAPGRPPPRPCGH